MNRLISILILIIFVPACSINRLTARYMSGMMDSFSSAFYQQSDPELAKEGAAAFLLITDAMIQRDPDNPKTLLAGVQAYAAYASAFLLESEPERAFLLFDKSRDYAMRLLETTYSISDFQALTLDQVTAIANRMHPEEAPIMYWCASAWGGWIASNPDKLMGLADLSKVLVMMENVLRTRPEYQSGGSHIFFGIYYCARPKLLGGDPEKGLEHFQAAKKKSHSESLLPDLLIARHYARAVFDQELFVKLTRSIIEAKPHKDPNLNLINALAKRQALRLLNQAEDLF